MVGCQRDADHEVATRHLKTSCKTSSAGEAAWRWHNETHYNGRYADFRILKKKPA